jgi:branched-chain amino acid transport system substrate-binding protein
MILRDPRRRRTVAFVAFCLGVLSACSGPERIGFRTRSLSLESPASVSTLLPTAQPTAGLLPGRGGVPGVIGGSSGGGFRGVVKLGTVLPLQGGQRPYGEPVLRTTRAYIDEINAHGGVDGYSLELIAYNACLVCPDEALQAVRRLVEQDHVFAIVNTYVEVVSFTSVIDYLVHKGVPLIQGAAENQKSDALSPVNFVTAPPGRFWIRLLREMIRRYTNATRVAITYLNVETEKNGIPMLERELKAVGITVTSEERIESEESTVTSMDSAVARMRSSGAQAVIATNPVLLVFGRLAASRQQWNVPWRGLAAWSKLVTDACGRTCDDVVMTESAGLSFIDRNTAQMRQYKAVMARRYPGGEITGHTLAAWVGMQLLVEVLRRTGPDRRAFLRRMESLHDLDLGTTAPLDFNPDRHMGATADVLLGIKNGRYVAVTGPVNYGEASP